MDRWARLCAHLDALRGEHVATPAGGRIGAALVLLRDTGDGDVEVVYTRRRDDLRAHPGQISFPGGRVDPGETVEDAALREAHEEVALDGSTVQLLGRLPAFYIPPSRFWLQPVVGRWVSPHPLVAAEAEVAEVLHARVSALHDRRAWRVVRLSSLGWSWAWQLDPDHLLWGATARVTAELLDVLEPGWEAGVRLAELAVTAEARPWDVRDRAVPPAGRALLPGVPERRLADVDVRAVTSRRPPPPDAVAAAGRAVASAAARLAGERAAAADVLVLAGGGGNGAAGLAAAHELRAGAIEVRVVLACSPERLAAVARGTLAGLEDRLVPFAGVLPAAGLVVDALVGGGLDGALERAALAVAHALRLHAVPVLSVDLPSGLDPVRGLVGDTVPADATVALGAPAAGLFHAGLGPFVGDLYVAGLDASAPPLVRLVRDAAGRPRPATDGARWRE